MSESNSIFDQIEKESNKARKFHRINPGEKRTFKFDVAKIEIVDAEYLGKKSKRVRYKATDINSTPPEEKSWEIATTHAVQLNALLKNGHLAIEVQRLGGGRDTKYVFIPA